MSDYVLIVDDDPDACDIVRRIVKSMGMEAQTAYDGVEALRLIQERLPILIILDLLMPRMDGYGVQSRLFANPVTRRIPVVIVSACERSQVPMLKLPGVFNVVQKGTFTVAQFRAIISDALTGCGNHKPVLNKWQGANSLCGTSQPDPA